MAAIHYLKQEEIDKAKWDACIDKAANGLIYAYSFYLDAMCDNWDALVLEDYRAVMPLPWRKKWGIKYVYQPPFMQRLGVFTQSTDDDLKGKFYKNALDKFSFLHYNVSDKVTIDKAQIRVRKNFLIELQQGYNKIRSAYTPECIKNIRKSYARGCSFSSNIQTEEVINLFQAAYGKQQSTTTHDTYTRLSHLINKGVEHGKAALLGVKDHKGETLFGAAVFNDNKRLYYIVGAPTVQGRKHRATYFFIDTLLKTNADKPLLFDFEGSDINNVASFYQKFGPITEHYYELKLNNLPWPVKWIKA